MHPSSSAAPLPPASPARSPDEILGDDIRALGKWLNEDVLAPLDRPALARVLAQVAGQLASQAGKAELPLTPALATAGLYVQVLAALQVGLQAAQEVAAAARVAYPGHRPLLHGRVEQDVQSIRMALELATRAAGQGRTQLEARAQPQPPAPLPPLGS